MFGLSFWEIAIVLGVALLILGPTKLPEMARSLGKGIREFRKATEDFKSTIEEEMNQTDTKKPRLAQPKEAVQAQPAASTSTQESKMSKEASPADASVAAAGADDSAATKDEAQPADAAGATTRVSVEPEVTAEPVKADAPEPRSA
ncbi:MAG: twin-arginine translocase TatA/TatE family subunit [Myxococcota bacterium]